jgi:hypothetical protein
MKGRPDSETGADEIKPQRVAVTGGPHNGSHIGVEAAQ